MARYLLAVSPIRGHVLPMVEIGAGLRGLGHDITVLTGARFADAVRGRGLGFAELPASIHIDPPSAVPALLDSLPTQLRRFWLGRAELDAVFVRPLPAAADALATALGAGAFDAVLADIAFTGAVPLLLGDRPRPPVLVLNVSPLTLSSVDTPPFGMAWQPRPGVDYRAMTAVTHRVIMASSRRRFDRALGRAGARRSPVFLTDWPRLADGLLQLSVAEFEYPRRDLPASVEFVGPALPAAGTVDPGDLPGWWADVTAAARVVHVTQGTFDNTDLEQLIGPTLKALGDRDDLLVVVATGGSDRLPANRIPDNVRVADWVPYAALMPHLSAMITNGGYGGVQHALSHGVPLVVAGETSDKAEVAARVDYTGVGVDLGTATPTPEMIGPAVDRVLADGRFRAAAQRIGSAIAASAPVDTIANALKRCADA